MRFGSSSTDGGNVCHVKMELIGCLLHTFPSSYKYAVDGVLFNWCPMRSAHSLPSCSMPDVLKSVDPFQIFKSIVSWVFINMIHFRQIVRIWKECCCY